jgi:hypothetical protein
MQRAAAWLVVALSGQPLPPGPAAFVVHLDSSGGFTGRGGGGVTLASDGRVGASRPSLAPGVRSCQGRLDASELDALRRAVGAAHPEKWPASSAPPGDNGCCDRYRWTLRVELRAASGDVRTHMTRWFSGNEERLPGELATIARIASDAMTRALRSCSER